jgi:L-fuconolactonase
MSERYTPARIVDAHQHLWVISERPYEWLTPEYEVLYRDYRMSDIQHELDAAGISSTVLVQASDSYADTFFLAQVAKTNPQIAAVVGWVALDRPAEAAVALEAYRALAVIRGVRALTHGYQQLDWIARPDVAQTLAILAERGFTLDYVGTGPEHRAAILEVARAHPTLKIALDHFTKPDIAGGEWQPWAESMAELAALPNVFAKVSGLNTLSKPDWSPEDWKPYVRYMVEQFGSQRLMIGSDWPFARLNGEFAPVWQGLVTVLADYSTDQQDDIYYRTAESFYGLS